MKNLLTLSLVLMTALSSTLAQGTDSMSKDTMTKPATMSTDPAKMDGSMNHSMTGTRKGTLRAIHAPTSGTVTVMKMGDGYVLKLSNFKTEPAPDLHVWLFQDAAPKQDSKDLKKRPYLDLGVIRTDVKSVTIKIPKGADLSKYKSVVLWCDQFTTAFAAADLK